jgi:hypothetical protein
MPLNVEALMAGEAGGPFEEAFQALLTAAYGAGYRDGMEAADNLVASLQDMTARLQAITDGIVADHAQVEALKAVAAAAAVATKATSVTGGPQRARRGLVGATLAKVLAEFPGRSVSEYEALVTLEEPEISVKSVGNELRRGERDGRFERDRPGGYHWYLKGGKREAERALGIGSSASSGNQGGGDAHNMT